VAVTGPAVVDPFVPDVVAVVGIDVVVIAVPLRIVQLYPL